MNNHISENSRQIQINIKFAFIVFEYISYYPIILSYIDY